MTINPPADLHIGITDGTFYGGNPFPAFTWMRDEAPAYFDESAGVWGITRYADIKEISKDPETFSNAGGIRPDTDALPMMIDCDAPEHVRRRRLVSEGFTPKRIRESEHGVREICDDIIDKVCEQGTADFVRDIAAPLPMIVIGNMLGVAPEDRDDLLRWSDDMLKALGSPDPTAMGGAAVAAMEYAEYAAVAAMEYAEYITTVVEQRRRDNQSDDLIGTLVHADIEGDKLDESSLIYESLLILIGGDETTRHVISGGMYELLSHPDQFALLATERDRLPLAVEEMLRWVSPIKNMARTATRDVELHGKKIAKGQKLLLLYPSANRDERNFTEPDQFDVTRTPTSRSPINSMSGVRPTITWPSVSAPTSAWATGWPGWSWRSCSTGCSSGCPTSSWPPTSSPPSGPPTSCLAMRRCQSPLRHRHRSGPRPDASPNCSRRWRGSGRPRRA